MTDDVYPDESIEVQWRVIWFPPDRPHRTYTSPRESAVRSRARSEGVAEWNPIVERREIVVGLWEPA